MTLSYHNVIANSKQKDKNPSSLLCPGTEPGSHPAAQTPQRKSFCGRHRGTLGTDWQPLKKGGEKQRVKQPIETLTQKTHYSPPVGTGALVSLTPLARVVFLQQSGAEVADVLGEEAGVLHPRLRRWVQAVGPVAVIQVLRRQKSNTLINHLVFLGVLLGQKLIQQ